MPNECPTSTSEVLATYKASKVQGATPGQLLLQTYDFIIACCRRGDMIRAKNGIVELMGSLDLDYHTVPAHSEQEPLEKHYVSRRSRSQQGVLVFLARDERDNAAEIFLQWFVTEQVEEEDNVNTILAQLRLIKDKPHGLFMLDKDLGQRVFTPPAAEAGT